MKNKQKKSWSQQHVVIPARSRPLYRLYRHRPRGASGGVPQTGPPPRAQTTHAFPTADRGAPRPLPALSLRFRPLCSRPRRRGHRNRPASGRSGSPSPPGGVELPRGGRRVRGGAAVWRLLAELDGVEWGSTRPREHETLSSFLFNAFMFVSVLGILLLVPGTTLSRNISNVCI